MGRSKKEGARDTLCTSPVPEALTLRNDREKDKITRLPPTFPSRLSANLRVRTRKTLSTSLKEVKTSMVSLELLTFHHEF